MNTIKGWILIGILILISVSNTSLALTFTLPQNGDDVVGKVQLTHSLPGDDFSKLGRRYDIGYYQLVEANPGIDPKLPVPDTLVVIPGQFIIPHVPHTGLVLNLAELRVYYFLPNSHQVLTYPVGIGREGWNTPVGVTAIVGKVKNPTWYVPESIRRWRAADGVYLPASVGPGPNNPLGAYKLMLGFHPGDYRMHGSNEPSGIGRRSSSGCIRLWPEDIEELFSLVKTGTQIRVMNDPYKAGWLNNKVYLESHTPLEEQQKIYSENPAPLHYDIQSITASRPAVIDWDKAADIADQQNGMPIIIGEGR